MEATEIIGEQGVVSERSSQIAPQMSVGSWILTFVLLAIPLVNIIMMFIWAFDSTSQRRNFARAYLIVTAIVFVLSIVLTIVLFILIGSSGIFDLIS